jgi:hypothetical protein
VIGGIEKSSETDSVGMLEVRSPMSVTGVPSICANTQIQREKKTRNAKPVLRDETKNEVVPIRHIKPLYFPEDGRARELRFSLAKLEGKQPVSIL